ncbi:PRD domain-containing protein [Nesterenkonia populi]
MLFSAPAETRPTGLWEDAQVGTRRQDQLISLLLKEQGWITGASLADSLGVTPRSVRSYISQINARAGAEETHDAGEGAPAVESGPEGYRADPRRLSRLRPARSESSPDARARALIRELLEAASGVDLTRTAERLHLSEATVEADLQRARTMMLGRDLTLDRFGSRAMLSGSEAAQRRLISSLVHEEMEQESFDVDSMRRAAALRTVDGAALGPFARELAEQLRGLGFYVNEFASADVALHAAIAADRAARGRPLEPSAADGRPPAAASPPDEDRARITAMLGELSTRHFSLRLTPADLDHLASLALTRVVAPGGTRPVQADPQVESVVAAAVARAAHDYMVGLDDPGFVRRLSLHVQNLMLRAEQHAWSRNPMTQSLKSAYPMVFEIAVALASDISQRLGVPLPDDEIGYLAMHVGGRLEATRWADTALTATIVSPGYYELHELLRSRIDDTLGASVEVVRMETGVDPDWSSFDTDLILSTVPPPMPDERIVTLAPFLTQSDVDRITAAAARVRRTRRLARLRQKLERYFSEDAFFRPLEASDEENAIRLLGEPLVERGVIDASYIEASVAREAMSSTAFTEALAVPHAMEMTATTTAISIGIAEGGLPWGGQRVQAIALVAFSEAERDAFQTVFEQLVEVFGERKSLQRIIRRSRDFSSFVEAVAQALE